MKTKLKKWKRLSTRIVSSNPYSKLEEDVVLLPNGKKKKYYLSNRDRLAVSIVAEDARGRILIQKEYRYPVDRVVYEFPGGMVDRGESPLHGAKREFEEETGFTARAWKKLGTYFGSPSRTNLVFHVYFATGLVQRGSNPDDAEFLEHEWISKNQLHSLAKSGTMTSQTMIASAFLYLESRIYANQKSTFRARTKKRS